MRRKGLGPTTTSSATSSTTSAATTTATTARLPRPATMAAALALVAFPKSAIPATFLPFTLAAALATLATALAALTVTRAALPALAA